MTKKLNTSIACLLAITAAIFVIIPITSCNSSNSAYEKYYDLEFHRGGRDARPENTLYAYAYAIEEGATTIEADMQLTKDGVVVMSHSPLLDGNIAQDENGNYVQDKTIDIRTLTYDQVKKYNVGHINKNSEYYKEHGTEQIEHDAHIPTLEELLQLVKDSGNKEIMLNLETKLYPDPATGKYYENNVDAKTFATKINDLIEKYGMSKRTIIQSFDWQILPMMKELNSQIKTSALWSETNTEDQGIGTLWVDQAEPSPWLGGYSIHNFEDNAVFVAYAMNVDIISPEYDQIMTIQVEQAHTAGMKVIPWTVNTIDAMKKVWEMECDGMITDKGTLARDFVLKNEGVLPKQTKFNSPYHLD